MKSDADVLIVNNFGQNSLSYVLDSVFVNQFLRHSEQTIHFITELLHTGTDISSTVDNFSLSRLFSHCKKEVNLAKMCVTLVHSGLFSPISLHTLFTTYSEDLTARLTNISLIERMRNDILATANDYDIYTPLAKFLVSENEKESGFAQYLYQVQFMTSSDFTLRSLFLKGEAQNPASLYRLSFAKVSDMIGPQPGRRERVRGLELPYPLGDTLLFQTPSQLTAKMDILQLTDEETDDEEEAIE